MSSIKCKKYCKKKGGENMNKYNLDVRAAAKKAGVYLYDIAYQLGISEPTMTRMLRRELPADKKQQLFDAIAALKKEQQEIR